MQIRRADVADALQITDVHVRSWKVGYRGLLPQDVLDGLDPQQRVPRWEATIELSSWPAGGTLVAEEADRLVGFANLCPTRDDDQDPASVGEVASFYVSPEGWGQGVGRALMDASSETLIAAGFLTASLESCRSSAASTSSLTSFEARVYRTRLLSEFSFEANPAINPAVIGQLATCAWVKLPGRGGLHARPDRLRPRAVAAQGERPLG